MCVSEVLQCYRYVALGSVASVSVNCVLNVFVFVSNVPVYGWAVCRMPATPVSEANQACDCWQGGAICVKNSLNKCLEGNRDTNHVDQEYELKFCRTGIELKAKSNNLEYFERLQTNFKQIVNTNLINCEHNCEQCMKQLCFCLQYPLFPITCYGEQ